MREAYLISAGDLRQPAILEAATPTDNEIGEQVLSWKPLTQIWISVEPFTAREILLAKQAHLQTTHRIRCRWFPGLTSGMRITWVEPNGDKRILNIDGLRDIEERHVVWEMQAYEVKGE